MLEVLNGVEFKQKIDGSWSAIHTASGRVTHGYDQDEAKNGMENLLGLSPDGEFSEPRTSDRFTGLAQDIALYIEGPISTSLKIHSGYARLEAFSQGIAHIKLGGGCQGCPSSVITLNSGVRAELQHHFGEEVIADVIPVMD